MSEPNRKVIVMVWWHAIAQWGPYSYTTLDRAQEFITSHKTNNIYCVLDRTTHELVLGIDGEPVKP